MTDNDILTIFMDSTGNRINTHLNSWDKLKILNNYQEIYDYLNHRFSDIFIDTDLREIIYRIKNKIEYAPICPLCGNKIKISKRFNHYNYICNECQKTQEGKAYVKKWKTHTLLQHYGVTSVFALDTVKNKIKDTNIQKYGVENVNKLQEIRDKIKNTNIQKYGNEYGLQNQTIIDKRKKTCMQKYGTDNVFAASQIKEKIKQTCISKYNVANYAQTTEYQNKINITKRKNNSFNTSKIEDLLFDYLKSHFKNIVRQHKTELYPFKSDFYIFDIDCYIEVNAHWTHGKHPFDKNNESDLKILDKWKEKAKQSNYYNKAIYIWTISDIKKRNIANLNHLFYIELFSNNYKANIKVLQKLLNIKAD